MLGCRKLHYKLSTDKQTRDISLGRDRLFKLLRAHGMLVKRRKSYHKTTYSKHSYAVAPNLIKNLSVKRADQVYVSDITYIRLRKEHAYLFLVTDLYSRKIVGYDIRRDLKHDGAINALKMTPLKAGSIHHSDRGSQYCCHEFLKFITDNKLRASMTDEARANQNAVAERVNGIIKMEFFLDATFASFELATMTIKKTIRIYNQQRIHSSIDFKTPDQVYLMAA